jgi:hypothetical protein
VQHACRGDGACGDRAGKDTPRMYVFREQSLGGRGCVGAIHPWCHFERSEKSRGSRTIPLR